MASETREQKTDRWKRYFEEEIEKIQCLEAERVHNKVLLMAVLDSLSKPVYPRRSNYTRFVETNRVFGKWVDGERVSLQQLDRLLEIHPDPAFCDLRSYVKDRMSDWSPNRNNAVLITFDPTLAEVRETWPKGPEHVKLVGGIQLERLTHGSLFYQERNLLVHEYREGGAGWDLGDEEVPFYQETEVVTDRDANGKFETANDWRLVYPLCFLENLCVTVLNQIHQYLLEQSLPAFSHYRFGKYWLEELRE